MPDVWEGQHGFSTAVNPPAIQATNADPDGGGVSNLLESIAGTQPMSGTAPNGIFRVTALPNPADPLALDLQWPKWIGKQYQVQSSADLGAIAWVPLGEPLVATGVITPFTTPPRTLASPRQFYRVLVTDPNNPDTDGDGTPDKTEILQGSSSTDPSDGGQVPAPAPPPLLPLKLKIFTYAALGSSYPTSFSGVTR